jgi:glycosyltransferase involved in cell wall biosynthesis
MRILAIQLNQPGDAILTTPALRWLMNEGHEVHALLQPLGAQLLQAMPGLASVEGLPRGSIQLVRDVRRALLYRHLRFDWAVVFSKCSDRPALWATLSGAPRRTGLTAQNKTHLGRLGMINDWFQNFAMDVPIAEQHLAVVDAPETAAAGLSLEYHPPETDREWARDWSRTETSLHFPRRIYRPLCPRIPRLSPGRKPRRRRMRRHPRRRAVHLTLRAPDQLHDLFGGSKSERLNVVWLKRQISLGPWKIRSGAWFFRQLDRLIASLKPDAVFTMHLKAADHLVKRHPSLPLVFEAHEIFADTYPETSARHRQLLEMERRVYARVRGVVAISSTSPKACKAAFPCASPCASSTTASTRPCSSTPPRRPTSHELIYAGSLQPWKGVPVAIEAMRLLPEFHLTVLGGAGKSLDLLRQNAPANVTFPRPGAARGVASLSAKSRHRTHAESARTAQRALHLPAEAARVLGGGKGIVASRIPVFDQLDLGGWVDLVPSGSPEALAAAVRVPDATRHRSRAAQELGRQFLWKNQGLAMKQFLESVAQMNRFAHESTDGLTLALGRAPTQRRNARFLRRTGPGHRRKRNRPHHPFPSRRRRARSRAAPRRRAERPRLFPRRPQPALSPFDKIIKLWAGYRKAATDAAVIRRFARRHGPFDAVVAQCEEPDGLACALASLAGGFPPLVTCVHDLRYEFRRGRRPLRPQIEPRICLPQIGPRRRQFGPDRNVASARIRRARK